MVLFISLLLVAQGAATTNNTRWDSPDILIEDSLGDYVNFAADYNYTTGDIYVACIPDSGTYFGPNYWGLLVFRSTDHGLSWDSVASQTYSTTSNMGKEIDLVVTRDDTLYALVSWYDKGDSTDKMNVAKIYDTGAGWTIDWIMSSGNLVGEELHSLRLVRDDFDDFYLFMSYFVATSSGGDTVRIRRSTDRGYNWGLLTSGWANYWLDQDLTTADSSLYLTVTYQSGNTQQMQFAYWRNRADGALTVRNPFAVDTTLAGPIQHTRTGATTTLPDAGQLVYVTFSQENPGGQHDLLYLYSEDGGYTWTSTPDTLAQGSYAPVASDIRGYQSSPNQYMNVTYCLTAMLPMFTNYYRWSSDSDPTNWHDTTIVGNGMERSITEMIYSPGSPAPGGGVVYNDAYGNLWFDGPWYSGISEDTDKGKTTISSKIVLAGSSVELGSVGAVVYDVTGREIIKLNTNTWDLKDKEGKEVKGGIYFIADKENNVKIKLSVIK